MKEIVTGWYTVNDKHQEINPDLQRHTTPQEAIKAHNARLWTFINGDNEKKKNIVNLKDFFKDAICDVRCVVEKGLPIRVCFLTVGENEKPKIPVVNNEMVKIAVERIKSEDEHTGK